MDCVTGYMLFLPESPLMGLREHPAFAPTGASAVDAEGWSEVYQVFPDRAAAEIEAEDDFLDLHEAVERGDLEDSDGRSIVRAVRVYADGKLDVLDDAGFLLARYDAEAIVSAYGMASRQMEVAA